VRIEEASTEGADPLLLSAGTPVALSWWASNPQLHWQVPAPNTIARLVGCRYIVKWCVAVQLSNVEPSSKRHSTLSIVVELMCWSPAGRYPLSTSSSHSWPRLPWVALVVDKKNSVDVLVRDLQGCEWYLSRRRYCTLATFGSSDRPPPPPPPPFPEQTGPAKVPPSAQKPT
jgi:hypothetical protein